MPETIARRDWKEEIRIRPFFPFPFPSEAGARGNPRDAPEIQSEITGRTRRSIWKVHLKKRKRSRGIAVSSSVRSDSSGAICSRSSVQRYRYRDNNASSVLRNLLDLDKSSLLTQRIRLNLGQFRNSNC